MSTLQRMADKIETLVNEAEESTVTGPEVAFDLLRHIFAREELNVAPTSIGEALEAGIAAAEGELGLSNDEVTLAAISILEGALEGFHSARRQRVAEADVGVDQSWVDRAIESYLESGEFPADAPQGVVGAAVRALASLPKR